MARSLGKEQTCSSGFLPSRQGVLSTVVMIVMIATQSQVVKSSAEDSQVDYLVPRCRAPGSGKLFTPHNKRYCIYAICYTEKQFHKNLFSNAGPSQYTDQIEDAAKHVCANKSLSKPEYGGGWMKTELNGTMNMFFVCCRDCIEWLESEAKVRLRLKNMYIARSYLNVRRIYDMIEADDNQGFYYKDRFVLFIESRHDVTVVDLPTCLSTNFTTVASLINIPVCWAKTSLRSQCKACGDKVEKAYLNIRGNLDTDLSRRLDPFNELRSRELEHIFCNYSYNENICKYWDNFTTYNVECCCYGNDTERANCQLKISSGGRAVDDTKTNCAVRTWFESGGKDKFAEVSKKLTHQKGQVVKEETRGGNSSLDAFINLATSSEQCETLLFDDHQSDSQSTNQASLAFIYAHGRKEMQALDGRLSSAMSGTPSCEVLAINDHQLHDIFLQQCYPGLPLTRMCPMRYIKSNHETGPYSTVCCCNDKSFCNHKGDLRAGTMYSPQRICERNNRYQELVNKYAVEIKPGKPTCLVHFANAQAMQSLTAGSTTSAINASVINVLPGAPLLPLDYSYTFLNGTDSCGYIEANIHWKYLQTRQCDDDATMNTEYLPLKLYVCRCTTPFINGVPDTPCDIKLMEEIAAKESKEAEKLTGSVCAVYEQWNQNLTRAQVITNRVSGACLMQVKINEDGSSYTIKGDVATGTVVNAAKITLSHSAYASLRRSGDWMSLCSSHKGTSRCFCRPYKDGDACNLHLFNVKVTLRAAYRTKLIETRTKTKMRLDPLARAGSDEGCLTQGGLLTIYRDENGKVAVYSECLHDGAQRKVKGSQCRRGTDFNNKCVLRNDEVVCCCMTVKECSRVNPLVINIINRAGSGN